MTGYSIDPGRAFRKAQRLDLTIPSNLILYAELMQIAENVIPTKPGLCGIITTSVRKVEPIEVAPVKVEKAEPEPPRSGRTPLNLNIVRGAAEH